MIFIKKQVKIGSLVLMLLLAANSAFGARRKLSPELDARKARLESISGQQAPTELIDVIVQARAGATLSQHRQLGLSSQGAQLIQLFIQPNGALLHAWVLQLR